MKTGTDTIFNSKKSFTLIIICYNQTIIKKGVNMAIETCRECKKGVSTDGALEAKTL